jgi:hypothetical protein
MPWDRPDEWIPPERYAGERPDLEAEVRRLAGLTREAQVRKETLERQVRARLAGYRPVDEVLDRADAEREANGNGLPYARELYRLAEEARKLARPYRKPARPGSFRLPDEDEDAP